MITLPTHRLASSALRALQVDAELSPLVRRTFSLIAPISPNPDSTTHPTHQYEAAKIQDDMIMIGTEESTKNILATEYKATTNRMLRVAVNGFMESLVLLLGVMKDLDVDVLSEESRMQS